MSSKLLEPAGAHLSSGSSEPLLEPGRGRVGARVKGERGLQASGSAPGQSKMAEGERQPPPDSSEEAPPATQNFIIPKKEIHTVPDMGKWKRSQAYADYIGFILTLNEGVKGKKLTFEYRVSEEAENLVATVVPTHLAAAVPEVAVYLKESVGNSTRIDYGTGHEAAFAAFLCCLCKIGVLRVDDQIAIVFKVFNRYLEVMRKLQKTYRMEPAGSQGVWGLDDFQFLPFIWGSSQLIDHPYLEPRHFVDEKAVNENHKDYMFLECILFITEMKTGPFAEHSNQLWNISAVPSWSKVNQGLIRMYKAEVSGGWPACPSLLLHLVLGWEQSKRCGAWGFCFLLLHCFALNLRPASLTLGASESPIWGMGSQRSTSHPSPEKLQPSSVLMSLEAEARTCCLGSWGDGGLPSPSSSGRRLLEARVI
ncbi:serine/threonine-protein phosphatase 2A activator isoform X6 [Pongo abelii]|uniref:serine/threonine-protein phosphatase 2A activator isoform X6 n=3 Tax=Pongo TaxID=9599 RepID=UPI0023E14D04|nr:serine/threonine-protein phosphatase 2A activator isoform X2 [Pongo pygmaeus]XP_054375323.1 serine/threonine-protein phosphatase 2A activator isoform X3 [Pongo abelii]